MGYYGKDNDLKAKQRRSVLGSPSLNDSAIGIDLKESLALKAKADLKADQAQDRRSTVVNIDNVLLCDLNGTTPMIDAATAGATIGGLVR